MKLTKFISKMLYSISIVIFQHDSSYGHLDIAALLLKHNTVVNAKDKWGFSPLHEGMHSLSVSHIFTLSLTLSHSRIHLLSITLKLLLTFSLHVFHHL